MVNVLILAITIYAVGMAVHKLLELLVAKTKCIDKFRKSVINRFSQKAVTFTFMIPLIVIEMIFWESSLMHPLEWGAGFGIFVGIMSFLTADKQVKGADNKKPMQKSMKIGIILFAISIFLFICATLLSQ